MSAVDDVMKLVDEVVSASAQCDRAHREGATWEQFSDDRKHYAARWSALQDMVQALVGDRAMIEYEAACLMTSMTDVLHHFTRTPSTLADTEMRGAGHRANQRMLDALRAVGAKTPAHQGD